MDNVRLHYEQSSRKRISNRNVCGAQDFRNYNNYVKTLIIKSAVPRGSSVLDICCGSGGDLKKLMHNGITSYCGIDISAQCIANAAARAKRLKQNSKKCNFSVNLVQGDAAKSLPSGCFDTIICNFGPHFFAESEQMLAFFLYNVASRLKDGGAFVGCLPEADKIVDAAMQRPEGLTVEFQDSPSTKIGSRYVFSLQGCIDRCTECVLPRACVETHGAKVGLSVEEWVPFGDLLKDGHGDKTLRALMGASESLDNLAALDRTCIGLYVAFRLRKSSSATSLHAEG